MKPISPKPIFSFTIFTSQYKKTLKNPHNFSFFSSQTHQYQNPVSNYSPRRHEEESRSVRVSVWWDFENCNLPCNSNVFTVAQCVTNAVRANGIKGPIQIMAFGDVMQISRTNQEALSSTGISLTHVPSGGKNSADRSLLVDLMYWVSQNPPPAHLFLISGDRDFAGILHRLRMSNYNILLASPDSAPSVLCSAATLMWQWSSLLKGENLSGRLFNQPPDGPYSSWYGHFRAPLEDPFASNEQSPSLPKQSSSLPTEESSELASDAPLRPIPKEVVKQIRQILTSNPEGISITHLRAELSKSNMSIDKDLYGYRKFSRFLSAMPRVVKLHGGQDGQYIVCGVNMKSVDDSVMTEPAEPVTNNIEHETDRISRPSSSEVAAKKVTVLPVPEAKTKAHAAASVEAQKEEKQDSSRPMSMQEIEIQDHSTEVKAQETNLQRAQKKATQNESSQNTNVDNIKVKAYATNLQDQEKEEGMRLSPIGSDMQAMHDQDKNVHVQEQKNKVDEVNSVVDMKELKENLLDATSEHIDAAEFGFFKRIWVRWFGNGSTSFNEKKIVSGEDNIEKNLPSSQPAESTFPAWFSPSSHEALIDGKIDRRSDVSNISSMDSNFCNQTTIADQSLSTPECSNKVKNTPEKADEKVNSKQLELFSKESFWNELRSYICSSEGAVLISQSTTREHLAQNLQEQGPSTLRNLLKDDLLHMVDLLISDKKWVEECDSQIYPFKLVSQSGKDPSADFPSSSNGLSRIFSSKQLNLRELGERKYPNPPFTGVPQPSSHRGSSSKVRSEVLNDCKKLVDHILKEYPEGLNLGCFRKMFLERNGYALDLQKLGYEKLVDLLRIIPGVRIESNMIVAAGLLKNISGPTNDLSIQESKIGPAVDSQGQLSDISSKDGDSDSSWDELGPVDHSDPKKDDIGPRLTRKSQKGKIEQKLPEYEPLNEDEFSDSDEEASSINSENEKSRMKEDKSSLLGILDSWYGKDGDIRKNDFTGIINVTNGSRSGSGVKHPSPSQNSVRKQKLGKSFLFVSEEHAERKDKMDILDTLNAGEKKSAEASV